MSKVEKIEMPRLEVKAHHSRSFALFPSKSSFSVAEKDAILNELKIEIKSITTLSNNFERIIYHSFFRAGTRLQERIEIERPSLALELRLGLFAKIYKPLWDEGANLRDLARDLNDVFLSNLSFKDKCITAMAAAEVAQKILKQLVRNFPTTCSALTSKFNNIRSLCMQGQGLYEKPDPFTGPGFSLS